MEKNIFTNETDEGSRGMSAESSDPQHEYSVDPGVNLPTLCPLHPTTLYSFLGAVEFRYDSKTQ